ncbi:IS3 family transposase, partial [Bacillus sp. V3B]
MKMRKKENPNQELEECIQSLFEEHDGNYGYRRIRLDLKQR